MRRAFTSSSIQLEDVVAVCAVPVLVVLVPRLALCIETKSQGRRVFEEFNQRRGASGEVYRAVDAIAAALERWSQDGGADGA